MKISIIIPVYNIKELLEKCIESVVSQTYPDKEIILIDDGSTDGSSGICDVFAKKYDYVKVMHKENQGSGAARNDGIRLATGDYIMFLDSDDYWNDENALERVVSEIGDKKYDLLIMGITNLYCKTDSQIESRKRVREFVDNEKLLMEAVLDRTFLTAAWDKIIKTDMIKNSNLFFQEGIVCEDFDWCLRILLLKPNTKIINECFLVHRLGREGSIQSSEKEEKVINNFYKAFNTCMTLVKNTHVSNDFDRICMAYIAHGYLQLVGKVQLSKIKNKKIYKEKLYAYIYLLQYNEMNSIKKAARIYNLMGYNAMCVLLAIRIKLIGLKRKYK